MKKKTFDAQTAKKIINEYAEKINLLSRENNILRKQLEDSKTSLQINKQILYSHFDTKTDISEDYKSMLSDLKKENQRLTDKINWLFTEKSELAKKLYKLQDSLNDKLSQENRNIEKEKTEKFLYENNLLEKNFQIEALKRQIDQLKKNIKTGKNNTGGVREIYIGDPNKFNTEMNGELVMSRAIIKKYIYLMQEERENSKNLKYKIQDLEGQISSISNNTSFINKSTNNPQMNLLNDILNEDNFNNNSDNNNSSNEYDYENCNDDMNIGDIEAKKSNLAKTQTKESLNKIPKLDLNTVTNKEPLDIQIVKSNNDENDDNYECDDKNGSNLLNKQLKSQIQIYKKTIKNYKEKINKMRKQIRTLIDKNSLLVKTLKMYLNKNSCNNNIVKNKNDDVSMNPNINDLSGISTNSAVFGSGAVENINKLNEINKIAKINQITNMLNSKIANKGDPLENININDNHYKPNLKENEITTKDSSKN